MSKMSDETDLKSYLQQFSTFVEDLVEKDNTYEPPNIDLRVKIPLMIERAQNYFKTKKSFDFEIKIGSNLESIKVHKYFLIMNGFKKIDKCLANEIKIDGNQKTRHLVENLIKCYYNQCFDMKVVESNVEELIQICDQLGIEELIDYLSEKKEKFSNNKKQLIRKLDEIKSDLKSTFKRQKVSDICLDNNSESKSMTTDITVGQTSSESKHIKNDSNNEVIDIISESDNKSISNCENSFGSNDVMDSSDPQNQSKDEEMDKSDTSMATDISFNPTIKPLTTQCIGFIPDEESEDNKTDESLDRKPQSGFGFLLPINDKTKDTTLSRDTKTTKPLKTEDNSPSRRMDFTKLLNSVSKQDKNSANKVQNLITQRSLRPRRSNGVGSDVTPLPVIDNKDQNYKITKLLQFSKNKSIRVVRSCFVPKVKIDDKLMVAIVGGPLVNWYNLEDSDLIGPDMVFESPNDLHSIAVTSVANPIDSKVSPIVYAIGSVGRVFIFRHQNERSLQIYDTIDGFMHKEEDVMDVVFHMKSDSISLFCGTSDLKKTVVIFDIKFDSNGRLLPNSTPKYVYESKLTLLSMIYVEKYDTIVFSGESTEITILRNISTVKKRANGGQLIPNVKEFCTITSLVYIPELDLIGFKILETDFLQMASFDKMMDKMDTSVSSKSKAFVPYISAAKLSHKKCKGPSELVSGYIRLSYNSGLIVCGDNSGDVYVYATNDSFKEKVTISPIQVIRHNKWPNSPPMILSTAISDDHKYLISTTDQNLSFVSTLNK